MEIMKPLKILIVEDSEQDTILLLRELQKAGYSSIHRRVDTSSEMSSALDAEPWDIVISDHLMPNFNSLAALTLLRSKGLDIPFIILSGQIGEDTAVDAMKAGANDYIMKGNLKRLVPAIQREIRDAQVRRERLEREAELKAKEEELRQRLTRYLATLQKLSKSLSEAKDIGALLRKALESVMGSLRFSSGALFIRDTSNGEFSIGAHIGVSLEFAGILDNIFAPAKASCNIKNIEHSAYLKHLLDKTLMVDTLQLGYQSEHSRYVISIPLKTAGKTIAIIVLPSASKKIPTIVEKQLLNTIGSQIGVAIENALLVQKTSQQSITDELTKLYNRRYFYKVLESELDRARRHYRPLSLAILDVDKFKEMNDKFGHSFGDNILKTLGDTMTLYLRKTDTPFRYGGDEFAVILPETDSNKAKNVIERVRFKWLHIPKTDTGPENPLGFSAGIAQFPQNARTQDSLVFLADAALYYSKKSGKNKSTSVSEMGNIPPDMLANASLDQVCALATTVDSKESYGYEHSRRVADVSEAIGKTLGLSNNEITDLCGASLLHDIGKIGISDIILNKSERLTPLEREIVKTHSTEGAKIVSQINKISNLAPFIRHHHEWYDGTGYPDGLKGQNIPLCSRIICIADAYDAMITQRVYRSTLSQSEALIELERCSGTQFDPEIIKIVPLALSQRLQRDDSNQMTDILLSE
jgi:diguanylate cyclase (GGDEF)-like protein/putative nucleotidyltransferase with HDIG domain